MLKYTYNNGFHFIGKFNELMEHLSSIKDKSITLKEYLDTYKQRLN